MYRSCEDGAWKLIKVFKYKFNVFEFQIYFIKYMFKHTCGVFNKCTVLKKKPISF